MTDPELFYIVPRGAQPAGEASVSVVDGQMRITIDGADVVLTQIQTAELAGWLQRRLEVDA